MVLRKVYVRVGGMIAGMVPGMSTNQLCQGLSAAKIAKNSLKIIIISGKTWDVKLLRLDTVWEEKYFL